MSKQVASAASSGPAAPAPQPPAAYGAAAMEDLLESIHWSGCEVLNATKTDAVGSLLKQGLRDQELMIVESDADEQLLISIAFKAKVKVHSIAIKAPADGRAPKSLKLFVNKPSMDCSDGESMLKSSHHPVGKLLTCLPRLALAQLRRTLLSTTGGGSGD